MKRIHFLLLGLLVSLTVAAVSPSAPPVRLIPGANTTIVTNGVNNFTISSAAGGSGAQLAGTNVFTGTNTFSVAVVLSGLSTSLVTKTTNFTLLSVNNVVLVNATSGNLTMTLPSAVDLPGWRACIKKTDATTNTVTVAMVGGQTIDGTTLVITTQYASYTLVSNGTNWFIL